ncbi:MAG: HAD family hydrolase [Proteiniphilum sp.]
MNELIKEYLRIKQYRSFSLKAVIFDMDGVLYDSMPAHDKSWRETMDELNLQHIPYEFYLQEGRIGKSTIDAVFQRNLNRSSTEEEEQKIYARKSELFQQYNSGATMPGAKEVLNYVKEKRLTPILVTGSGQPSLLNKLDTHFPGIFTPATMVTAFDVVHGKPHPEPFLMGLQKGGNLAPNQAIVIENAPLGIEAAVGAGIFTIAVNTGPLPDSVLRDAGASLVYDSMTTLFTELPGILSLAETLRF